MTLKLGITQGYWKYYHSVSLMARLPISGR